MGQTPKISILYEAIAELCRKWDIVDFQCLAPSCETTFAAAATRMSWPPSRRAWKGDIE